MLDPPPKPAQLAADVSAELLPHRGLLKIQHSAAGFQVAHLRTLERKMLPAGDWSVIYDDDGYAVGYDASGHHEEILLEDFLEHQVFKLLDGDLLVCQTRACGSKLWWSLTSKYHKFCQIVVSAPKPRESLGGKLSCNVYEVKVPRDGFTLFWLCSHVYALLGLQTHSGLASKWVWVSRPSWLRWCQDAGLDAPSHVLKSVHCVSLADRALLQEFLPEPAMSTAALIVCLCRWAFCTPQNGGFRSGSSKEAAGTLLRCLLRGSAAGKGWSIHIRFASQWNPAWPCDEPNEADLKLQMSPDLLVRLCGWEKAIDEGHDLATAWWDATIPGTACRQEGTTSVPLTDFLARALAAGDGCNSLFRQVVWQCARRAEGAVKRALKNDAVAPGALTATTVDMLTLLDQPVRLDHELMRYILAGQAQLQGQNHLSYICDKGNVAGQQLMPAMFATSSDIGVVACPQVSTFCQKVFVDVVVICFYVLGGGVL